MKNERHVVIPSEARNLVGGNDLRRHHPDSSVAMKPLLRNGRSAMLLLLSFFIFHFPFSISAAAEPPSPIEFMQAMSRSALQQAGAEKLDVMGPDGKLVYWMAGDGPTIVLVHGTNDQAGLWWRTVAALKDDYRVVVPDMPGHGESEPVDGPLDLGMMKEAVETIVDHVSVGEPVILVGNSMGGWAALLYAIDNADHISRLILEDSGGIALGEKPKVTLTPTTREEARAAFDAAIGPNGLVPDPVLDDFVKRAPTSPAARLGETSWEPYLLDDRLGEITVPTTLIWGGADEILPPSYGERMKSLIPDATMITIPGCGHIPHNECPAEYIEALNNAMENAE